MQLVAARTATSTVRMNQDAVRRQTGMLMAVPLKRTGPRGGMMPNGGTATFTLVRISLHRRGIREPGPRLDGSEANDARSTTYQKMTHFSGSSEPFVGVTWLAIPATSRQTSQIPSPETRRRARCCRVDGPNHSVASWTLAYAAEHERRHGVCAPGAVRSSGEQDRAGHDGLRVHAGRVEQFRGHGRSS